MPPSLPEPSAPLPELRSSSLGEHPQASPYPPTPKLGFRVGQNHTWATSTARAQATTTPDTWSVTMVCHRGDDLGKNLGMMESCIYRRSSVAGTVESTQEYAMIHALRGTQSGAEASVQGARAHTLGFSGGDVATGQCELPSLCAQEERHDSSMIQNLHSKRILGGRGFCTPKQGSGRGYAGSPEQHYSAPSDLKHLPFLLPGESSAHTCTRPRQTPHPERTPASPARACHHPAGSGAHLQGSKTYPEQKMHQ